MQSLEQPLAEAITSMMRYPSDQEHVCPYCGKVVPKFSFTLTSSKGVPKVFTVQPACKCEAEAYDRGILEVVERKEKNEIERKFAISSLGDRFAESRFDTFQARNGAEKAYTYAKQYAQSFPDYGGDGLLIWGEPGNGKSHLAAAVCHTVKEKGYIPVFQSVPELLERIRHTFSGRKNAESERGIMDALLECDLLVLDDIGAEKVTDWVQDILFRIVDGRYRQKKPILYTSNLRPSELQERLGGRIYDRMMETSLLIENKATSFRMEVAKQRFSQMTEKEKQRRMWAE